MRPPPTPSSPRRGTRGPDDFAAEAPVGDFVLVDDLPDEQEDDREEELDAGREMRAHSTRRQRRRSVRLHRPIMALPLTPLIDVVFQLLVFFLLVTDFSGPEEVFQVDLPQAAPATEEVAGTEAPGPPRDPFRLDRQPVRVLVTSTGPGDHDYLVEVVGANEELPTFERLEVFLRRQRADPGTRRGLYLPDHPIVLEPSPATSWEHSVGAFNAAVRAGFTNVVFRGTVGSGGGAAPRG